MLRRKHTIIIYVSLIALLIISYSGIVYLRYFVRSDYDRLSRVVEKSGVVTANKSDGQVFDTFVGMSLVSKDMVVTGEQSVTAVNIDRINAQMEINEMSMVLVDELSTTQMKIFAVFRVIKGQVYNSVQSKFDDSSYYVIKANDMTFSSRDADFTTVVEDNSTASISVLRGSGNLTYLSPQNKQLTMEINAGQSVTIENGNIQIVEMTSSTINDFTKSIVGNNDIAVPISAPGEKTEWKADTSSVRFVKMSVVDDDGHGIEGAEIVINQKRYTTGSGGSILHEATDGTFVYSVSAEGFSTNTGTVIIDGFSVELYIPLTKK